MSFKPDQTKQKESEVPYFEDARKEDGWEGHATGKSMEQLKGEITGIVARLGGAVVGFAKGSFDGGRPGFRLHYTVDGPDGKLIPGQIDIAALPVKPVTRYTDNKQKEKKMEQSLRMALYMFRDSMKGSWFMQQLSPGYSALMPFMMFDDERTVSQAWFEQNNVPMLMPPDEGDFIDGEVNDV